MPERLLIIIIEITTITINTTTTNTITTRVMLERLVREVAAKGFQGAVAQRTLLVSGNRYVFNDNYA